MSSIVKLVAATALLGALSGCANMGSWMPNLTPSPAPESIQDPAIYGVPADG